MYTYEKYHAIYNLIINIECLTHTKMGKKETTTASCPSISVHDVLQVRSCDVAGGLLRQIHQAMFLSYLVAAKCQKTWAEKV